LLLRRRLAMMLDVQAGSAATAIAITGGEGSVYVIRA
jgi:hypothetical protein